MKISNTVSINGFLHCTDKEHNRWEVITNTKCGFVVLPVAYENGLLFDDICDSVNAEIDGELIPWTHGAVAIKPHVIDTESGVHNERFDQ